MSHKTVQIVDDEWMTFPGGELEGKRVQALCPACREQLERVAAGQGGAAIRPRALCFQCYRAGLDRDRALKAAGELDTASPARFQFGLPFEPVNKPRLERLKAERAVARATIHVDAGRYADKRRQAQIAARHALDAIAAGLDLGQLAPTERDRLMNGAIHAAELQLPESWLSFVVAR